MNDALKGLLGAKMLVADNRGHAQIQRFIRRRIPSFAAPKDVREWNETAPRLRARILSEIIFRGTPREVIEGQPAVVWRETISTGKGYVIRKLAYEAYPGLWMPALLYQPEKLEGKVPAVLNPNGHEPLGKAVPYKQARCINLAKRGMLALSYDWPAYGQLRGAVTGAAGAHNSQVYLDLCGRSGVAVFYLVAKRALDVLLAQPNADPGRVAVTGLSGGGWQTIVLSALDTRVSLATPVAGYIDFASRVANRDDIGDKEQNPTDLGTLADYTHLTALMAPRPTLVIYNDKDFFHPSRARPGLFDPVRPVYTLYGKTDCLAFHTNTDPGTHNYDLDNRQAFYRFLNAHFVPAGQRIDREIESGGEILPEEKLRVDLPKINATWVTLGQEAMAGLPRRPQPDLRAAVGRVIRFERLRASVTGLAPEVGPYHAQTFVFHVGDEWQLPAVEVSPEESVGTAVVITDGGRSQAVDAIARLLQSGRRVIAVDLLFDGEMAPDWCAWQLAQMIETVGQRPLGVRVSQIVAVTSAAAKMHPGEPITLVGIGRQSAVAAVLAAGLGDGVAQVVTVGLPASLKDLITGAVPYEEATSLFCFGLLEVADVEHLVRLVGEAKVRRFKNVPEQWP